MIDLGGNVQESAAYGMLKPGILLFDCQPGTRSVTLQPGRYRVAVVGAGAGGAGNGTQTVGGAGGGYAEKELIVTEETIYSYTVGNGGISSDDLASITGGETTSFAALISATGGEKPTSVTLASNGGIGIGGDINTQGGDGGVSVNRDIGGSSPGHRFGNGVSAKGGNISTQYGAGLSTSHAGKRGISHVDGWGLGIPPGFDDYGVGAANVGYGSSSRESFPAGMGGGGAGGPVAGDGGIGAGAGSAAGNQGGNGLLIVEKLA